jgi:hypothetical protein
LKEKFILFFILYSSFASIHSTETEKEKEREKNFQDFISYSAATIIIVATIVRSLEIVSN